MSESNTSPSNVSSDSGAAGPADRWGALVVQIAAGDSGALSEFYDQANHYVQTIAMRILRDPDEAEEITLDVFQQVWRLAASYRPERCAVASWVAMMTRSRALDRWRSLQARRRLIAGEQPEDSNPASPEHGPEMLLAGSQRQKSLRNALQRLPDEQRNMITLAFWDGLSHTEVAALTGVPLGTVKTRIRLGMLKLREDLEDAGIG